MSRFIFCASSSEVYERISRPSLVYTSYSSCGSTKRRMSFRLRFISLTNSQISRSIESSYFKSLVRRALISRALTSSYLRERSLHAQQLLVGGPLVLQDALDAADEVLELHLVLVLLLVEVCVQDEDRVQEVVRVVGVLIRAALSNPRLPGSARCTPRKTPR